MRKKIVVIILKVPCTTRNNVELCMYVHHAGRKEGRKEVKKTTSV